MSLLAHVEKTVRERKLFRRGERILVAVSGGVDSMVLLHLLHQFAALSGWKLSVVHFNHQLRGRASDADEQFVSRTATALGLPFHAGRGDVKGLVKQRGISMEMAARELRHKFLAQTARRLKCPVVALAHHADDQVELFFLRLLRGAGGEGLAGMKWISPSPISKHVRLVRPLLNLTKTKLADFARENKIQFREDASNSSQDMFRNRVRHELLPLLRQNFQPALERTVLRLMEVVGAESEVAVVAAKAWLAKSRGAAAWHKLPVAVQRRVLQLQLRRLRISPDFDLIESLRLQPERAVSINPQRLVVSDSCGRVKWAAAARSFNLEERKLNLKRQTTVLFGGLDLSWDFKQGRRIPPRKFSACEYFDADKVGSEITLRHWQPGDRFQPIGMKLAVKLQDWFTNQKIPAARRRELVVATTRKGDIFWIEGLRIGEQFKLTAGTRKTLMWRW